MDAIDEDSPSEDNKLKHAYTNTNNKNTTTPQMTELLYSRSEKAKSSKIHPIPLPETPKQRLRLHTKSKEYKTVILINPQNYNIRKNDIAYVICNNFELI